MEEKKEEIKKIVPLIRKSETFVKAETRIKKKEDKIILDEELEFLFSMFHDEDFDENGEEREFRKVWKLVKHSLKQNPLLADEFSDDEDGSENSLSYLSPNKELKKKLLLQDKSLKNVNGEFQPPRNRLKLRKRVMELEEETKNMGKDKEGVEEGEIIKEIGKEKKESEECDPSLMKVRFYENRWHEGDQWCTPQEDYAESEDDDGLTSRIVYDENALDWIEVFDDKKEQESEVEAEKQETLALDPVEYKALFPGGFFTKNSESALSISNKNSDMLKAIKINDISYSNKIPSEFETCNINLPVAIPEDVSPDVRSLSSQSSDEHLDVSPQNNSLSPSANIQNLYASPQGIERLLYDRTSFKLTSFLRNLTPESVRKYQVFFFFLIFHSN
jgi:hypothetical protein